MESSVFKSDMDYIVHADFIDWSRFAGKTFFVTGGTGLIGYYFISALLHRNKLYGDGIHIMALVRSLKKAAAMYQEQIPADGSLRFIVGNVEDFRNVEGPVDFILHGASPTASRFFVEHPVETIETSVAGSRNMLELAWAHHVEGMVYLSSMEIYGDHQSEASISEEEPVLLRPMNLRDSYPISKALVENMCRAYAHEYGVPVSSLRLSQVIGTLCPPLEAKDTRILMEIARDVLTGQDIVLKTKGESKRTYIYVADAVTAMLKVLETGGDGSAYNVANPDSYCSIYDLCQLAAGKVAGGKIAVKVQELDASMYPKANYLHLNPAKLSSTGWKWNYGLAEMVRRICK